MAWRESCGCGWLPIMITAQACAWRAGMVRGRRWRRSLVRPCLVMLSPAHPSSKHPSGFTAPLTPYAVAILTALAADPPPLTDRPPGRPCVAPHPTLMLCCVWGGRGDADREETAGWLVMRPQHTPSSSPVSRIPMSSTRAGPSPLNCERPVSAIRITSGPAAPRAGSSVCVRTASLVVQKARPACGTARVPWGPVRSCASSASRGRGNGQQAATVDPLSTAMVPTSLQSHSTYPMLFLIPSHNQN
jgi:hypothetical protein